MKELSQEELKDVSGGLALNKAPAKDGLSSTMLIVYIQYIHFGNHMSTPFL